jgi:hypothetical protein
LGEAVGIDGADGSSVAAGASSATGKGVFFANERTVVVDSRDRGVS